MKSYKNIKENMSNIILRILILNFSFNFLINILKILVIICRKIIKDYIFIIDCKK